MKKWQVIELDILGKQLERLPNFSQKLGYLKQFFPGIYRFMLEFTNWSERVKLHVDECYEYHNNLSKYCLYVHGYFAPLLEQRRADGKLDNGKLVYVFLINTTI